PQSYSAHCSSLYFSCSLHAATTTLPSFPTRRSSDLGPDPRRGSGRAWAARAGGCTDRSSSCRSPTRRRARASRRGGSGCGKTTTDRKSTRLNSSHQIISYAVFCLKKKKKTKKQTHHH